jgi:hypothetical protein
VPLQDAGVGFDELSCRFQVDAHAPDAMPP